MRLCNVFFVVALAACASHQQVRSLSACSPADTSSSDVVSVASEIAANPQAANQLQVPELASGTVRRITDSLVCASAIDVYRSRCGATIDRVDRIQVASVGKLYVVVAPAILEANPQSLAYQVFDDQWQFRGCFTPTRFRKDSRIGSLTRPYESPGVA